MIQFGTGGWRAVIGDDFTKENIQRVAQGIADLMVEEGKTDKPVMIGYDRRFLSKESAIWVAEVLAANGAQVLFMKRSAPTPLVMFTVKDEPLHYGIEITASHNPSQYNGLKMTYAKQTLGESQIKVVKELTEEEFKLQVPPVPFGQLVEYDLIPDYINDMKKRFGRIGEGIKVVVDSANGTGGVVGPKLYRALGCEVIELYSLPDGRFPHHHPNPSDEKTLNDIKKAVVANNADLGIAFDGDSDRIGVIDSNGNSMTGDKLLLIYSENIIKEYNKKGIKPVVVSEVKCSQVLYDTINANGGIAVMCKTGHGYIKSKMRETGAVLAGEMSGHTFFKDTYYGFDDAVYAGCRIIEIIANKKKENPNFKISDMLKPFEAMYSSSEVRLPCPNSLKSQVLESFQAVIAENPNFFEREIEDIITIDGMRIVFKNGGGFALIRQSNTEPVFTLRFEADSKENVSGENDDVEEVK